MTAKASAHYGATYFQHQKTGGSFGGWADIPKFAKLIQPHDKVLDFGCGTGKLLAALDCAHRVGIEPNPIARQDAETRLSEVHASTSTVPSESIDVVMSNHALEHTLRPLDELRDLHRVLRNAGKICIVVPCEAVFYTYRENDITHHLYSWSPMALGNLLTEAGFSVTDSRAYIHRWPPKPEKFAKLGRRAFDAVATMYGYMRPVISQVRAVGMKVG